MTEIELDNGLKYDDLVIGDGTEATGAGQTLVVHYTGCLEDGTQFDSSIGGKPFSFPLHCDYVIKGWDQGIVGMKVSGKRKLTIPPELAYGKGGFGDAIPANSTLIFEIELLEISE